MTAILSDYSTMSVFSPKLSDQIIKATRVGIACATLEVLTGRVAFTRLKERVEG